MEKTLKQESIFNLAKRILLFSIPLMLSGFLQLFYNAADVIVVGQFSGEKNPRARAIYCPELNEFFLYAKEASEKYGIDHSNIIKCCKGKQGSAGRHPITGEKLHWVYVDEMDNSSVA